MKNLMFVLFLCGVVFFSCKKEEVIQENVFKTLPVYNLRETNDVSVSFKLSDYPLKDQDYAYNDTMGTSKVSLGEKIIFDYQWGTGYQSSIHHKTIVYFSVAKEMEVIFIKKADVFFNELAVINNGELIKKIDFSTASIEKVEVNEFSKQIRIVSNNTWIRTAEYKNDTLVVNY